MGTGKGVRACAVQNPLLKCELPGAVIQSTSVQGHIPVDLLFLMRDGCYPSQAGRDAGKCTSVHVDRRGDSWVNLG